MNVKQKIVFLMISVKKLLIVSITWIVMKIVACLQNRIIYAQHIISMMTQ